MKRALITGMFGQDGSYLAELLIEKGYEVHGVVREALSEHSVRLKEHLAAKEVVTTVHLCDLMNYNDVLELFKAVRPAECYHLAAVHYPAQVALSDQLQKSRTLFEQNTISTLNLLSVVREVSPETRFVLAGSCMVYDNCEKSPQDETRPFCSKSVYGLSKIAASQLAEYFCIEQGLHAATAILYNHESPRRQPIFVTQKIVRGLVAIQRGSKRRLELGNLHGIKDWGYAKDYAHGMWLMARADEARPYILATGTAHTVEDFIRQAADVLNISDWRSAVDLKAGITGPPEKAPLIGNSQAIRTDLGWCPSITFPQLVELMVEHELRGTLD